MFSVEVEVSVPSPPPVCLPLVYRFSHTSMRDSYTPPIVCATTLRLAGALPDSTPAVPPVHDLYLHTPLREPPHPLRVEGRESLPSTHV